MNEEIKFLREHIKDICSYKGLQEELTYDVSLDILKRICIAFDYLQQENQKLNNILNKMGINPNEILYLKQENQQLKERINKAAEYIYDEDILKILKEDNKEEI